MKRIDLSLMASVAAAALIVSPAAAQQDAPPAGTVAVPNDSAQSDPDDQDQGVEEIVITARKLKETLSDAPVSVSAVTSDTINELGLNSIEDFARQATGISFSQAFGRSTDRPVIRGQSNVLAGVQAGVETGAAFFVDGVYYQGDIQGFDPQSIERVEIIKGPQSALYGRNTYAGAINYITKDPTDAFSVTGRFRFARYKEAEGAASVSGQIVPDVVGFRAGVRYFTYGGEYTNQLTGRKVGQEETQSAYVTLLIEPTSDIRIRPRAYWQKDDDGPLAIFLQGAAENNCFPGFRSAAFRAASPFIPNAPATLGTSTNNNQYYCGVIRPRPDNVRLNTDPLFVGTRFGVRDGTAFDGIENEQYLFTNVADWDIGGSGFVLSSLTGYRDNENLFGTDSDHSDAFAFFSPGPAPPITVEPAFANTNRDDQKDFSQEIRLTTPKIGPFRFLIGGFYYKQKFQSVDITFASGKQGAALGTDLSEYSTIENKAAFGSVTWDIFDNLELSAEVRYAEEVRTQIQRSTATSIFCAGQNGRAGQFGFTGTCLGEAKFTGTDPRVTLNYQTPGGVLFYGVFATGRKPGGFNGVAGVAATAQTPGSDFVRYVPEKSKGGEVGVKFDAFGRRLRVAASAFYNELTNVQLTSAIPNPGGQGAITSIVTNSGDAETKGFEVEAFIAPTRNLNARLGVAYVDARFTKGCDADEFILNSGGLRPNFDTRNPTAAGLALCNIEGRRLPLGSPWQVNGNASYDVPLGDRNGFNAFVVGDFSYEASKFVQVHNQAETGKTFLVNARVGLRNDNVTLALFGRNLTDEDTIPLATRWFDVRYGLGTRGLPAAAGVTFDGRPAQVETGFPRGFFATLRKGRTFGVEATFGF